MTGTGRWVGGAILLLCLLGAACTDRADRGATPGGDGDETAAEVSAGNDAGNAAGGDDGSADTTAAAGGGDGDGDEPDDGDSDSSESDSAVSGPTRSSDEGAGPDTGNDGDTSTAAASDDAASDDAGSDGAEGRAPRTPDSGPTTVEPVFLFPAARGDSGDAVQALQARLTNLGFAPGTPDGTYGRKTSDAVAAFQFLVDLEQTGEADDRTIAALTTYRYDGIILLAGDEGDAVETLQRRLADGPFDPGPIDGEYGLTTVQAVWALEKLAGMPVDGNWGPLDEKAWELLAAGEIGAPTESHDVRWVEVSLSEQLVKVYDPGQTAPTLISHVSSGSGIPWSNEEYSGSSITPIGDFEITRRISGWRESSLNIGRLYNPLYFRGGIAFHGATSVPLYPASHGCVRVPMHIAEYLPDELPNGTAFHVDA
ncbi:MAG: L,D-transpeptidase family protein [Actinomycetota bacterium]